MRGWRHRALFACWPGLVLAVLACTPARLSREIASFQRELDVELVEALEPREGPGLEAACHHERILWLSFVDAGEDWRLMSVDGGGQVGIWSGRGLERTWSLDEDELAWVRNVATRQRRSEDADWLFDRARINNCARRDCGPWLADIAPRDDRRWVGVADFRGEEDEMRITASERWVARGDRSGSLSVAPIPPRRSRESWASLGCVDLRRAAIDELVLIAEGNDELLHVDLRWGLLTFMEGELEVEERGEVDPRPVDGSVEAHPVAGFEEIDAVVGQLEAPERALVVAGGGVLGVERLSDGAVLRVIVHDRRIRDERFPALAPKPDGLSLLWLDAEGRRRCRFDGSEDDHAASRVTRVADAGALLGAFLSGEDCPGG